MFFRSRSRLAHFHDNNIVTFEINSPPHLPKTPRYHHCLFRKSIFTRDLLASALCCFRTSLYHCLYLNCSFNSAAIFWQARCFQLESEDVAIGCRSSYELDLLCCKCASFPRKLHCFGTSLLRTQANVLQCNQWTNVRPSLRIPPSGNLCSANDLLSAH